MKILDRYILKSFVLTFATVFIILFFIFILQGIWLFISDLAGKDLDAWLIMKFLLFYSPKIVPLVLPLSVLLASIMTFGNFAENYEFAAMKSSGISLSRAMRSLTFFIFGLSLTAFFFANNVIPKADYQFTKLRTSIANHKPAMAIVEGQFNALGEFNIKVEKKSGENGEKLSNVTIHKRKPGSVYATIIRAKKGLLKSDEGSNLLQLILYDGYYYEEIMTPDIHERQKLPFAKSSFTKEIMNIDLSQLNKDDDKDPDRRTESMLNFTELSYTLDSLQKNYATESKNIVDNIVQRSNMVLKPSRRIVNGKPVPDTINTANDSVPKNLLGIVKSDSDKAKVLDIAQNVMSSSDFVVSSGQNQLDNKMKNINSHWLSLYEKFVIAFSCILMFFIGAPLGAIIRKGGLGLPMVFAMLIFITFHFINTFGKKLGQENGIPAFMGSWMSTFVLAPLAVTLTYRATNDIGIMGNFDWFGSLFRKLFPKNKRLTGEDRIIELDAIALEPDAEWEEMDKLDDDVLISIVKNSVQYNYSDTYRIKALKTLQDRGITQQELLVRGELYNAKYEKVEEYYDNYKKETRIAMVTYILGFLLPFSYKINILLILVGLINAIIFYTFCFKAEGSLESMGKVLNRKLGVGKPAVILGYPFFIFAYLYERKNIKEALSEYR